MSKAIITEQLLTDIADELRDKYESTDTYTPAEMAEAVSGLTKVSGSIAINVSGTIDVKKYESADVPSGVEGVPTVAKGTVSNHSVSVTPSVTNESGFISGGTHTGTPVTVSASELVSGSETKIANGTYDVTNLSEVVVDVPTPPSVEVEPLSVTDNGTYTAPSGTAYSPVTVNVSGGGGITADEVALRTISGAITGSSASYIGSYAFRDCSSLAEVSFPACTNIGGNAFYGCSSLTEANFPVCTSIGSYAFQKCSSLTGANFPVCRTIAADAFYSCRSLTEVSFPVCTSIGSSAFQECSSLTEVSFPACTSIGSYAFYRCSSLTGANFPVCRTISFYAFQSCISLISISFPVCTTIGPGAFYNCSSLTEVSFPACTSIAGTAFQNCRSLTEVSFPVCTSIGGSAFADCSSLTEVSFPACTSISTSAFRNCYNLLSFNLAGVSSVPTLSGTSVFYSTPIGGRTTSTGGVYGSVYVPASLYSAFISAANWSSVASRIVSVE